MGLNGYDAVAHMYIHTSLKICSCSLLTKTRIEEIPNPSVEGPRIMIFCVALGILTGVGFLAALLLVSGGPEEIDHVIQSSAGPLLEILYFSTRSHLLASFLLMFPLICLVSKDIKVIPFLADEPKALWHNMYYGN
jgi:choline transport protein